MKFKEWNKIKKEIIIKYFQDNDLLLDMKQTVKDNEELDTIIFCNIHINYLWANEKLRVPHWKNLTDTIHGTHEKLGLHDPTTDVESKLVKLETKINQGDK